MDSILAAILLVLACTGCTESAREAVFGKHPTVLLGLTAIDGTDAVLVSGCNLPAVDVEIGTAEYEGPEWEGASFVVAEVPDAGLSRKESPVASAQLFVLNESFDRLELEETLTAQPNPQGLAVRLTSKNEGEFESRSLLPPGEWPEYPSVLLLDETDAVWNERPADSLRTEC